MFGRPHTRVGVVRKRFVVDALRRPGRQYRAAGRMVEAAA